MAILAGGHTDIWLEREDLGKSLLLCPGKMLSPGVLARVSVMAGHW
jgi:hypothetical protein